jgi:DNA-binding MarR family transcriptional regulator
MATPPVTALHRRRLREIWRSAGWPCQDMVEIELLAAGLLERLRDAHGRETLRVTDSGVALIAESLQANRARRDAHEALVERVAREMTRAGRIAWRGLSLRAKVGEAWAMAMPDVFSVRNTTVEDYLEPVVHEIKVQRADLLADLKRDTKRAAYLQLGGECWYVLRAGIARAEDIPPECGVMFATDATLDVARPAPKRVLRLPFGAWMALARATPVDGWRHDEAQRWLGDGAGHEEPPDEPTQRP